MHFALDSDRRIAVAGGAETAAPPGSGPFLEAVEQAVALYRDRTALRVKTSAGWRELTYAQIAADAREVASWLVEQGVVRGTTIALVSESRPEWAVALLGVVQSGATLVPIDPKLTATEIANLLGHARPRFVLASRAQDAKVRAATAAIDSVERALAIDGDAPFAEMRPRKLRAPRRREASEVALVVYTSGTTGSPKGVEVTFGNLLFEARAMAVAVPAPGPERFLSVLPLNHLYELICGFLVPFFRGATITYGESLLPDDVAALLRDESITSVVGVPLLWSALKRGIERSARGRGADVERKLARAHAIAKWIPGFALRRMFFAPVLRAFAPALRAGYSGGAALDAEVSGFFARMGIPIYQGYGMTEASPVIATNGPHANRFGSVGRPLEGIEVRIVKKEPADTSGEIQTRGPHVMAGYGGEPAATRDAISEDGWLATGDLGFLDDDGFLWVTGRSKDLVVLGGGKKVHPDEVEEALARSPMFAEVCVVGAPATRGMANGFDEVWAVVVPGPELASRDVADVVAAAEEEVGRATRELAAFKRPTRVALRFEALPRTATRKLQRPLVREWLSKVRVEKGDKAT